MLFRLFLLFCLCSVTAFQAKAATAIPQNLSASDRTRVLQIIGYGSGAKILDDPYPLGGYSGVEIGLAVEIIPTEELASLGNTTNSHGNISYETLTFSKGLFYNVDVMVYFSPFVSGDPVSNYGGTLRWGFYEASFFPLTLTALVYAGGMNYGNELNVNTMGADLIATLNISHLALYVGGGQLQAQGTFIGGPDGVTDTGDTLKTNIRSTHTVAGLSFSLGQAFAAVELNHCTDANYSGKLGFRF